MAEPTPSDGPLPCPFCGGDKITQEFEYYLAWCLCEGCGACGPYAPFEGEDPGNAMRPAIDAWNRRTPLIAAAPDLLAFARAFVSAHDCGVFLDPDVHEVDIRDLYHLARAALAKARPPEAR